MNRSMEELIPLVAELTDKYTSKESSSIPYSTAQQLMGAVLYCIRAFESAGSEEQINLPEAASRFTAREAYYSGYQTVLEKVEKTRLLYHEILAEFHSYGNQAYRDTFEKGMPAFFLYYDVRFQPQNHILTLDYPVLASLEHSQGIDIIASYITCVGYEQQFLRQLPESFILHVLSAYHPEHETLIINVAEIVFRNLMGCMLVGKQVNNKGYTESEQHRIASLVSSYPAEQLTMLLNDKLEELISIEYGDNQDLRSYLSNAIPDFSFELRSAVKYNHLEQILAIAGI
ncbi:MAG: DUF6179 domain-containing protein [Lachnospiraceae bacterium]